MKRRNIWPTILIELRVLVQSYQRKKKKKLFAFFLFICKSSYSLLLHYLHLRLIFLMTKTKVDQHGSSGGEGIIDTATTKANRNCTRPLIRLHRKRRKKEKERKEKHTSSVGSEDRKEVDGTVDTVFFCYFFSRSWLNSTCMLWIESRILSLLKNSDSTGFVHTKNGRSWILKCACLPVCSQREFSFFVFLSLLQTATVFLFPIFGALVSLLFSVLSFSLFLSLSAIHQRRCRIILCSPFILFSVVIVSGSRFQNGLSRLFPLSICLFFSSSTTTSNQPVALNTDFFKFALHYLFL